jgi:hypothetical protein
MDKDGYHGYDISKLTVPDSQAFKFHDPRPNNIVFYNTLGGSSVEVLRISAEGVTANPDIPTDEAAQAVLRSMDGYLKQMIEKAVKEKTK